MSERPRANSMDALDADLVVASVMAAVRATVQDRRPGLAQNAVRALGVAAALALATGGLVFALNLPRSNVGTPPSFTTTFQQAGLRFDYPSTWTLSSSQALTGSGLAPAFFVGSVRASATCVPVSGGAVQCDPFAATLDRNTLAARIVIDDSTPWRQQDIVEGQARSVVVGGLPALMGPSVIPVSRIGADRVTTWILTSLQDLNRHYVITVAMRGPDLPGLQRQIDALLASISFDPPAQP